ncbi:hexaprenyldihydroxybenzoate methyltransferase, mitochondrial [Pelobates cultripes]|uniref:Ubiquinone biosynthesis O-methyltransferase, mitochondrial n=3 Tax=Pelobates cultripes TaxID=61616 RepID=A0AAD1RDC7_PELCU|nr:hexaprenyldihydroxybenzoate methyltransferase, mitochondrial [Pelobates cultripes]
MSSSLLSRLCAASPSRGAGSVRWLHRVYCSAAYQPCVQKKLLFTRRRSDPLRLSGLCKQLCPVGMMHTTSHTVDPLEMKKFQAWSSKWWDEEGVYSPLHAMNEIRVPFIRDILMSKDYSHDVGCPLAGVTLLDVGCGGGILSEPLGRLGATVTGIDPLEDNIKTAELHKSYDPTLEHMIQYRSCSLEDIVDENKQYFDAVVASEVIEHVVDKELFIQNCFHLLKPGGSLIITTINKTKLSYALGIVVAEKIMGLVPEGTHDWEKFISPEELERILESNGYVVETLRGMLYNPLSGSWSWIEDTSINYAIHAVKTVAQKQSTDIGFEREWEKPKAAQAFA